MSAPAAESSQPQPIDQNQLIERWANCERVLAAMPEHERQHHFDMSFWGKQTSCGTVACAAGTCGMDPWFRERGFKLDFDPASGESQISDVASFFGFEGSQRIFYDTRTRPVENVLGEVREYVGELQKLETLTAGLDLPAIGTEWPEQGGIYAGARLGANGAPDYLLVVGPERDGLVSWKAAMAWATDLRIGEFADYTLPNRSDGTALFDRVRSLFQRSWYWLGEQHADYSSYAWDQHFSGGDQILWSKGSIYRARAVRRVPIQSFNNSVISSPSEA